MSLLDVQMGLVGWLMSLVWVWSVKHPVLNRRLNLCRPIEH